MRTWIAAPLALAAVLVAPPPRAEAQTTCPTIETQAAVTGLSSPLFVTHAGDGTNRLFVVERPGTVKVVQPGQSTGTVFLTIPAAKILAGDERGLLGLAFSPDFETNRRFFVSYTRKDDGAIVLAEYLATNPANPANQTASPSATNATEIVHLVIPHPDEANHNGGMLAFGPGGYLFMSVGDGGSSDDPLNNAQNINRLLGKILRLDVDTPNGSVPYSSPADNPYFGATAGRDEIYALGLRNTWRFSFDRGNQNLIAGDVGQGAREEVDYINLGGNYGWRVMEGTDCNFANDSIPCNSPLFTPPLLEYTHSGGRCSITGGYVYRGTNETLPDGTYVYADFCTGEIFGVDVEDLPLPPGPTTPALLVDAPFQISSFGEDEAGESYAVTLSGSVNRLLAATRLVTTSAAFDDDGGTGSVEVIAPSLASCAIWNAASNADWIDITSGGGIKGNGTVAYSVAPNPDALPRTGTMTIAGHTFTVTQGASAIVNISVDDLSIGEGHAGTTAATFFVTLSGASGSAVSVQYATAPGTATAGTDYVTRSLTTLTFAPGETSKPVTVMVKGDVKDEPDETFFLNLSNPTSAVIADGQAVATILDDDPLPAASIGDISFAEGSGNKSASFSVTLSAASDQTVLLDYATGPGSATVGTEYTAKSGTLTFTPGQKTKSVTIATKGDVVDEPNETFVVNLTSPVHATLADAQAVATILDDDEASPSITASISNAAATEGNTGVQSVVLTVTLSAAPTQTVSVGFATAANTAAAGKDFNNKTGTVSFNAGQTSKTLTVGVKGDLTDESTESFFVNLQAPLGVAIGDGQGVVTISDNDGPPSVSIGDVSVTEGNSATKNVTFTATLSAASGLTVTAHYATANGTAVAPGDYTATSGTLTFAPGQASRTFTVAIKGDTLAEPTEAFSAVLSAPTNATLGDASGTATITDNDGV
jgi:glucose/arabinose dehydrogenase